VGDGQFRSTTAAALGLTLGYFDDTVNQQVIVMPTFCRRLQLDGSVDGSDYAIFLANRGHTGQKWQAGDANYDGQRRWIGLQPIPWKPR